MSTPTQTRDVPTVTCRVAAVATTELGRLVVAAADGDAAAWNALVERLVPYVRAVTRAHRLSEADAADVNQTCWLRLVEHIDRIANPDSVACWLGTTARRECQAFIGKARRTIVLGDDDEPEPPGGPAPEHDHSLLAGERQRALAAAFGRLAPRDQALLRLRSTDPPMPYDDIVATLGMAKGSIGPTLRRALDHLKQQLQALGVEPDDLRP